MVTGTATTAMSSQPKQIEPAEKLPDASPIRLRSVRPEDELLLQDLAAQMSPEDMRARFFAMMRRLRHELAARLSQIGELHPNLRDVAGGWLLCGLIAAFALGLSTALRPAAPRFSSAMTAGLQTVPRSWSTCSLTAASESSSIAAPSLTPNHRS
jgi:hypothetical protein